MKITPISDDSDSMESIRPNQSHSNVVPVTANIATSAEVPAGSEASAVTAKEDPFSAKYAELAKREKILRSKVQTREAELKAREDALKAKELEYTSNYIPKNKIPEMFQADAWKAMQELGLNGDQLTNALLNQPSPQDQQMYALKQEIQALRASQDQSKTMFEERDKAAREQAVSQIKADLQSMIEAGGDSYEIIKATQSEDDIVKHIEKTFDETNKLLTIDQAAAHFENQILEDVVKLFSVPKIKAKVMALLQPEVSEVSAPQATPNRTQVRVREEQIAAPRTVANRQVPVSGNKIMDSRERAIALLEGRLT